MADKHAAERCLEKPECFESAVGRRSEIDAVHQWQYTIIHFSPPGKRGRKVSIAGLTEEA
jgi:hypothetical protein